MRHDYQMVQAIARDMIDSGANLRSHWGDIDEIIHSDWSLPEQMNLDWIVPVISPDPSSAFFTAEKTLALNEPNVYVMPTNTGVKNAERMNDMEMWLQWQLARAGERGRRDLVPDIVHSALRYDYICAQVVHLNHEMEANRKIGVDKKAAIAGTGDFSVRIANPNDVYFKESIHGLEAVLHVYETRASDIIMTWGNKAKRFQKAVTPDSDDLYVVYDYTSLDQRMVWVKKEKRGTDTKSSSPGQWKILDVKWELPFLNWVIATGGTVLEYDEEYAVQPLLGRIARTGLWDLQNMMWSLVVSEAVATAAAPRFALIGPNGERVKVEYHDPTRLLPIPPGHTIEPLPPRQLDDGLLHLMDRIKAALDRETVARFLQNLDLPDRAAYASINAVMEAAISALDRYKKLSERALRQMFWIMYSYVHYREETSIAFGGEDNQQVAIGWDEYDPDYLFVEVELDPLSPADYLQRINAGRQLQEMKNIPDKEILRFLGFNNPEGMKEEWAKEQLEDFELQQLMKKQNAASDAEIMMLQQQTQMQMQQAMQQQQQNQQAIAQQQAAQQQQSQQEIMMARQRQEAMRQGANPAAGGLPNAMQAPGDTREMVTGERVTGEPNV